MMKRKPQTEFKYDASKPVNEKQWREMGLDCFGEAYSQTAPECQYCAANTACSAIFYKRHTTKKIAELKKERGPFMDELDFDRIPWAKIAKAVKAGKRYRTKQLFDYVRKHAKSPDSRVTSLKILTWIKENNLAIENGAIVNKPA